MTQWHHERASTHRIASVLFVALILSACAVDYTKPGNSGGTTPTNVKRGVTYDQSRLPPTVGVCGQTYSGRATVRQQVFACAGYDYTDLYDRALASARFQTQRVTCPEACAPRHDWIDFRHWSCVDLFRPMIAHAAVETKAICPRPQDAKPAGLAAPAAGALTRAPNDENGPASGPIIVVEEIGDATAVACPATDNSEFEYSENVATCQGVNYQPFVQRAVRLATLHDQSVPCATGCAKAPFRALNTVWTCEPQPDNQGVVRPNNPGIVRVKVYYAIQCVRSP
ncbi:MAG: hypothetical protein GY791_14930 [Alphaproteobacteria bacterium]|nr:hypothetical protein [Alphaproteobacteria bacterium]